MPRTKISEFSSTPANNTDIDSINISEGCAPSGINDAIRELMSQLKDWQSGTSNDPMVIGSSGSLTLNQGTANGVAYLNGSKVVTSGSALTFDGTTLNNSGAFGTSTAALTLKNSTAASSSNIVEQQFFAANSFSGLDTIAKFGALNPSAGANNYGSFYWSLANAGAPSEKMRLDSSGNLGLGVTPSAWGSSWKANQIQNGAFVASQNNANDIIHVGTNAFANSSNAWTYIYTAAATRYQQYLGAHSWYTAPSGTAGNAITFTQRMTLDASGYLLVGGTSSAGAGNNRFQVGSTGSATSQALIQSTTTSMSLYASSAAEFYAAYATGSSFLIGNGPADGSTFTERARIDSSGDFTVGTNGTGRAIIAKQDSDGEGWNGASTALYVGKVNGTGRSINAGGTINASGADYAEYMVKAGNFTVAKGDVVGIDAQGKLTNVFANALSFVVKSTDPSYVGGDIWGVGLEGDELEVARQTVDRIAFAGQVPVNVLGASAGQFIIPVNDNGSIKGQAVSNPTFEQYQSAVGKVIAIEADGRARIIVKVA